MQILAVQVPTLYV